jgi:putative nucleotidyltransferase with HDIG domain
MENKPADRDVSLQIDFAVHQLQSLSALPENVGNFLSRLNQYQFTPQALTELVETEPAIAVQIIRLLHKKPVPRSCGENENPKISCSVRLALEGLTLRQIRDAVLSVDIYSTGHEEQNRLAFRRELVRHSIAVALAARQIAETAACDVDPESAYLAGLLHDIGKLALDQILPKSFARIVELARKHQDSACNIERQNLGIDHTIIGKRLAESWLLPGEINLAVWLHHNNSVFAEDNQPEAKIARIVRLADIIARQQDLGQSGSFDKPVIPQTLADSLSITASHIEQIRQQLDTEFERKTSLLELDSAIPYSSLYDAVRQTAAQLTDENQRLSVENQNLQADTQSLKFITEFLDCINPQTEIIEIARQFALLWQRFYQTGAVCLYILPAAGSKTLPAIVVQSQTQTKLLLLNVPPENSAIPESITESSAVADAADLNWLFEQIPVPFEPARTKIVPLSSDGRIVAVLVFELRQPVSAEKLGNILQPVLSAAADVFTLAMAKQKQQYYAEQFSQMDRADRSQLNPEQKTEQKPATPQAASEKPFEALTEMAAGAAHELNNPLVIISGRAQLLAEAEQDERKKKILEQISDNSKKASQIIDQLMSFANPPKPKPHRTDTKTIIDNAVQLASQKTNLQSLNIDIKIAASAAGGAGIFADPDQIVTALANIICNAVESYLTKTGPVKIAASAAGGAAPKSVILTITDLGCGMDSQTLQKATFPFYSAKPAGRKRGMGLPIAKRLIEINGGSIEIASQPAEGTVVTILLPVR